MTGEELHILRRRRKLSQAKLAELVGLSRVHVSRLERDETRMSWERAEQFRRLLDPAYEVPELAPFPH